MGRPPGIKKPKLKASDVPRIQALIDADPECTCAGIARIVGIHRTAMARYANTHGLVFGRVHVQYPVRAVGLLGDLMRGVESKGKSHAAIARNLQVSTSTVSRWRLGEIEPTLFLATCLAEMAGYELVLRPLSEVSSQDGRQ